MDSEPERDSIEVWLDKLRIDWSARMAEWQAQEVLREMTAYGSEDRLYGERHCIVCGAEGEIWGENFMCKILCHSCGSKRDCSDP